MQAAEALGIEFEGADLARLGHYLALLLDTNRRFNLTSVRDATEAWTRHIYDSLTLLPLVVTSGAKRVIDVGSGGGLPGVPLAIALSSVQFTLVEATGKKARFLSSVRDVLALANVTVCAERAEVVAHDTKFHREHYDLVVARAVGPLATLVELTAPFAKVGGRIVAIKGERAPAEIADAKQALKALSLKVEESRRTATGTLVTLRKIKASDPRFPRRSGEPAHHPLGSPRKGSSSSSRRPSRRGE